jgi:hypothetical protein
VFDLALSISSLHEMTPGEVKRYLDLFGHVALGGTVFLKQWAEWHNPDDDVVVRFDDYPVPPTWQLRLRERSAVQTGFVHAAWAVPPDAPDGVPTSAP